MKNKKTRRIMAFLLTLTVMMTTILGVNYDTARAATGPADGQVEYVGGTNSTEADATYDIAISKTIQEVSGKENYFDITLQTTTHRHIVDLSTDVVVVLDVSNTMNDDSNGNATTTASKKKITYAKNATKTFVSQFANNENLDENRRIGIVTFNRDATTVVPLTEANDQNDYISIANKINAITAPSGNDVKWTNIQGGLKLAANLLENSNARYKYVVLITDGFPTTYLKTPNDTGVKKLAGYNPIMSGSYNKTNAETANGGEGKLGYFANTRTKELNTGGVSYSNRAAEKAQQTAAEIKKSGISIFSVGVALGSQNLSTMWSYIIDTTGMKSNEAYAIGTSTSTYKKWLEQSIAGGSLLASSDNKYSDAYNQSQLEKDFSNIMQDIEHAPETTMRSFYTLDPMSDVADFISFYDKDGNLATNPNKLVGESKQNAENTAVYGGTGNEDQIDWDMLNSGFTMNGENLVFTLKYRVRLKNEMTGFDFSVNHEMNNKGQDTSTLDDDEEAKLIYSQKYVESGEDVEDGTGEMKYPNPRTEGYKGSLKFKKTDGDTNEALANIPFTLQHYGTNCSVCEGDAVIADVTEKSDANGYVEFADIPSGHEYYLIEDEPIEYAPMHKNTVIVSYGETYIGTKSTENHLVDGVFTSRNNEAFVIKNTKVEPVEIEIQTKKTIDGNIPAEGAFQFQLKGYDASGAERHEIVPNAADGTVKFGKMVFDVAGTYTYTISEIVGTDPNVVYDASEHVVQVDVYKNTDGTAYMAEVEIDGKSYDIFEGKDNTVETVVTDGFTNVSRGDVKIRLAAKKQYDNHIVEAGQFTFKIDAVTENAPLPVGNRLTKTNDANGDVIFDGITFTTPGTYVYKISEVIGVDKSIVYDTEIYEATVVVTAPSDLTSDSALDAVVTYKDADGTTIATPLFVNKDRKLPTITMEGYKSFNGKDAAADAFTFVIQEVDNNGNAIGAATEVKNSANGVIDFHTFLESVVSELIEEINDSHSNATEIKKYKIYEKAGTVDGVEYDDTYYVLRVGAIVSTGSEYYHLTALMQKVDGENVDSIFLIESSNNIRVAEANGDSLVNFENTSKVKLNLTATKKLESENTVLKAGDYNFILEGPDGRLDEATNDEEGNVKFDTLEFTAEDVGMHSFVVYEKEGSNLGLFYDDSLYTVTVEVRLDNNGNLSISEPKITDEYDKTFTEMEFINKDMTPTHLHLNARKTVNGQMPTVAQKFNFQLINADTNDVIETIHNVHDTIAFSGIELDKTGTYNYIVKEVLPENDADNEREGIQKDGFTYDQTTFNIQVIVTDKDNDGNLEKKVTVNGKEDPAEHNTVTVGTFKNTYLAKPVTVALEGKKELDGRDLKSGEFHFVLEAVTEGAPMPNHDNVEENSGTGTFKFDEIAFTEAGTYEYTVKEVVPEDAVDNKKDGITYDTTVYNVKIAVKDNGKGQLIAEKTVNGNANTAIVFENKYETLPTAIRITADKSLRGRTLQNGEFEFELVEVDKVTGAQIGESQIVTNGTSSGMHVNRVYFNSIRYDEPGEHVYKVREVIPEDADKLGGVTYDTTVYVVNVKVTDNGKGQLVATIDGKTNATYDAGEFVNTYRTTPVTVNPEVTKELKGRDWMAGDSFTFTLEPVRETPNAVANGTVTLKNRTVTIDNNDADRKAAFGDIRFTAPGTYHFSIAEVKGQIDNVAYDEHTVLMTVTVTDNQNGALEAEVVYNARTATTFTNVYTPDDVEVVLKGEKTLNGRELKAGEFEFAISATTAGAPLPADVTVTNNVDGSFAFGKISYGAEGTYEYQITETKGSLAGVDYDAVPVNVTVDVTYASETGLYNAAVTYVKNEASVDVAEFKNNYGTEPVSISLEAKKHITDDGNKFTMKAGDFQFGITPAASNPSGDPIAHQIVVNDVNGNAVFKDVTGNSVISYTKPGTYLYTVNEVDTNLPGITYDDTVYRVQVVVKDDETTAKLSASVTVNDVKQDSNESIKFDFTNIYDLDSTNAVIHGHKILDSGHKKLEAGEFQFTITAHNDTPNAPLPTETTVTNTAAGVYQFGAITFEREGVYKYQITEAAGTAVGYTYDDSVHEIKVEVSRDSSGEALKAVVTNVTNSEYGLVNLFINGYQPKSTTLSLNGNKILDGRDATTEDNFQFKLNAVDNAPVPDNAVVVSTPAEDGVEGAFAFDVITYTKAGTYKYTISEVKGNLGGVTYDETVYDVIVDVTDVNGELSAKATYSVNGTSKDEVLFKNEYNAKSAKVTFDGAKNLTGRDLSYHEFEFALYEGKGTNTTLKETVKNDEDGYFKFSEITYDAVGEHSYVVKEVISDDAVDVVKDGITYKVKDGVTYDTIEYVIKVSVTDNKDGNLVAKVFVNGNEVLTGTDSVIVFANEYNAKPTEISLVVDKNFQVPSERGWLDETFEFNLVGFDQFTEDPLKNATTELEVCSSSNAAKFGPISLDEEGMYRFEIRETAPEGAENRVKDGITYDDTIFKIRVDVKDDGYGNLYIERTRINGEDVTVPTDNVLEVGTFVNTYDPGTVPAKLVGIKRLEGKPIAQYDGAFTFGIKATTVGAPLPTNLETTNDANGNIAFGDIKYTEPGVYKYLIYEKDGNLDGIVYDKEDIEVTVQVGYDTHGNLTVKEIRYNIFDAEYPEKFAFYNKFKPMHVTVPMPGVTKEFVGRDWFDTDKFTFVLDPADDTKHAVANGHVILEKNQITITKSNMDQETDFGNIIVKEPGTYKFVVREVKGDIAGVSYDSHKAIITVKAEYEGENGVAGIESIKHATDATAEEALTFVNKYEPDKVRVSFEGTKVLDVAEGDRRDLNADEFEFVLSAVDGAPMPLVATASNAASGRVEFGEISFTEAGTYNYEIKEVKGKLLGITYDETVNTAQVVVTYDEATGVLSAEVSYGVNYNENGFVFTNRYETPEAYVIVRGIKVLIPKRPEGAGEVVTLEPVEGTGSDTGDVVVTDAGASDEANESESDNNDGPGVNIPESDNDNGSAENQPAVDTGNNSSENNGVASDSNAMAYGVASDSDAEREPEPETEDENTDDEADASADSGSSSNEIGTATDSNATPNGGVATDSDAEPNNGNSSGPGAQSTKPRVATDSDATKHTMFRVTLSDEITRLDMKAGDFEFAIMDGNDEIASAKNEADGTFEFAALIFTEAGTYNYTIVEKDTGVKGFTYDQRVYGLTVVVIEKDGKLEVESVKYTFEDKEVEEILFVNEYEKPKKPDNDDDDDDDDPKKPEPTNPPTEPETSTVPETPEAKKEDEEDLFLQVLPMTGDVTNVFFYLAIVLMAGMAVVNERRKED